MGSWSWGNAGSGAVSGASTGASFGPWGAAIGGVGGGLLGGLTGGKGSKAPAAPDFNAAAEQQAASSRDAVNQQTQANRPNQSNAFGTSVQWTRNPDGSWSQKQSFGGDIGTAAGNLESQIAANSGKALDDGTSVRQQAIDATYGQAASRLDPQWSQREAQTRSQLSAQGLDPGSEAYDNAMGNFSRDRNDAYSSAQNSAISNANQAQALTFAQNLQAQEAPYSQLGQLGGYTQMPGFNAASQAQATQYLPAAMADYQGQLQQYGIDQQGKNSKMGGMGNMAGAGMSLLAKK
jgi:hypothetical protein